MGKEVEVLEYYADLAARGIVTFQIVRQLDPVDDNASLLMFLEAG
jgi:hypothetical protein